MGILQTGRAGSVIHPGSASSFCVLACNSKLKPNLW